MWNVRRRLWLVVLLTFPGLLGCAHTRPIAPGDDVDLGADQGLLVVHVRTNAKIDAMYMSWARAAEEIEAGEHVTLIGADAGT